MKKFYTDDQLTYLLNNPDMLFWNMSRDYAFTPEELRQYYKYLKWNFVSNNHRMTWTIDILDEFIDDLDFSKPDQQYSVGFLSMNRALPWSIELLERYKDRWDWRILVYNESILQDADILFYCFQKLMETSSHEEAIQMKLRCMAMDCRDDKYYPHELIMDYIYSSDKPEEQLTSWDQLLELEYPDWNLISRNTLLPWDENIIELYKDELKFETLSMNKGVPWDINLIRKFKDKVLFGLWEPGEGDKQGTTVGGLCMNPEIKWNSEMLNEFYDDICFMSISKNEGVDWSLDLLREFDFELHHGITYFNKSVFRKAFPLICNHDNMKKMADILIKKLPKDMYD
jgi:hypothetical protein